MNTITDLRRSLEDSAHSPEAPSPSALLQAVQDDIATGRDKGNRTPRLAAAAAALALVAGGGWALSNELGNEETSGLQPATSWELVDGAPPEYVGGLALVDTVTLGPDSRDDALTWEGSGQGYAVVWCDVDPQTAPAVAVALPDLQGDGATAGCVGESGDSPGGPTAVPSLDPAQTLGAEVITDGGGLGSGLEADETVIVGLYREAAIAEFPYPDQQAISDPPTHDVVINATSPKTNQTELADLTEQGVMLPAATVESHDGTVLTTWAGEPGRLLVAVNGTVITNDGEGLAQPAGAGRWQDADPDLRGGYWHSWAAGASTREFDLSPAGLAAHGIQVQDGDQVVVAASGAFPRDAWQVGIDQPAGVAEAAELTTVEPTEVLPAFAYGYEQVTAVSVPADGAAHEVNVGDVDPTEVVWVAECPESMLLTQVQMGSANTQCNAGLEWLLAVQDAGLTEGEPVEVTVASGAEPVTVAAYVPRVWEDYVFEESTDPMAASAASDTIQPRPVQGEAPPELAESQGPRALYREVATVGSEDLDADGRAEVTVPSSTDLSIWIESVGVSRVQLKVDGTPIDQLLLTPDQPVLPGPLQAHELLVRDGWYSTWTAEPTGHELRLDQRIGLTGHGERDNPTVTIEVDADGGDVELVFYEFVAEEDWQD